MSQLSFSDEFLVLAFFFWLAHKLHYIQYKADISRWACSTTGKWKNMHFRLWGELVTRCLWELWSLFKVYVLKGPTSHLCKLHMGPRMASNLVEMYVKTELWRTTLHTHTHICRVIKESMETCMTYLHFSSVTVPEKPWSWQEQGRLAGEMKPYRICGSTICARQQSHRGHWRGSTLQLEEIEVERTHILGETVTTRLRLILHPWEQGHWDTVFFPLQPGLIVRRKVIYVGRWDDGSAQVCPHNFVVRKLLNVSLCGAQTRLPRIWDPGAFWLAKNILLWCHAGSQWDDYGNGDCALSSPVK